MTIALLIISAPLIYWVLGAALLTWREDDALMMAPLLGGGVAGLLCELAYVTGARPQWALAPAMTLSIGALLIRRKDARLWKSLALFATLYLVALIPAVISPFPILGIWDGDWFMLMTAGQELFEGVRMTAESLQRPPLFGGATSPLWLIASGLPPYQVFCAAMSAGALGACLFTAQKFWPKASHVRILALIALSPFFLHHTAACWGKLMAAGLLVAACVDAHEGMDARKGWWSAVWFALATAVHSSSIIYAPLIGVCFLTGRGVTVATALRGFAQYAIAGAFIVGAFELWMISEYGLDAKIHANPAVAQREADVPFALNTLLVMASSVVAWAPVENVVRWLGESDAMSASRVTKESYWLATSWLQMLAGSFLGAYLPLLLAGARPTWIRIQEQLKSNAGLAMLCAVGGAILANGMLSPYYSSTGSMQTGLVGLGLGGMLALCHWSTDGPINRWRLAFVLTLALGTLPWMAFNLGATLGVETSESFRSALAAGSEEDWKRLTAHHLTSLGIVGFPYLQLALAGISVGLTTVSLARYRRASAPAAADFTAMQPKMMNHAAVSE